MSCIKVMDELLSNKIAAGEVVEKCVSIVKELIENSIDAKSTDIKVYLVESGLKEIKVIDNGIGMEPGDAILAFQRHATSKLYDVVRTSRSTDLFCSSPRSILELSISPMPKTVAANINMIQYITHICFFCC